MSLVGIGGVTYEPTAIYSFEFFRRDPVTKTLILPSIAELYFLLPPEEYSMQEGYKINVTKTGGGGWVDDFGNDFKTIKLVGSLYSYYTGVPATTDSIKNSKRSDESPKDELPNNVNFNSPGIKGLNGLEEFFKLRYIISRFRDEYQSGGEKQISQNPKVDGLDEIFRLADQGENLYDNIGIVYHDYDDANHFEVIFQDFTARRNKEDPFTVNYSIDMLCLKEVKNTFFVVNKGTQKENPKEVMAGFRNALTKATNALSNARNRTPRSLLEGFDNIITSLNEFSQEFDLFRKSIISTYTSFTSRIANLQNSLQAFSDSLFEVLTGEDVSQLLDETTNMTEEYLDYAALLNDQIELLSQMAGTGKYYDKQEQERVYDVKDVSLNEEDFDQDAIEENPKNVYTSRNKTYHTVIQGDTLANLAQKFYNDHEKANIIAESNGLTHDNFNEDAMVGKSIIIPLETRTPQKTIDRNLIYYEKTAQATLEERRRRVLGADIKLNENREIVVDGTGDIAMIYAEDCYLANIEDRLKFPQGTLKPYDEDWGIILEIGKAPQPIASIKLFDNIEGQVLSDPRTERAFIDRKRSKFEGDVTRIPLDLKPVTGEGTILNAEKLIPGLKVGG